MADFAKSIISLRRRAKIARVSFILILAGVLMLVGYAFTFVVFRFTRGDAVSISARIASDLKIATPSPEELFFPFIKQDLYKNSDPGIIRQAENAAKNPVYSLETIVGHYERVKKVQALQGETTKKNEEAKYSELVSTFALSVGAVALMIYLLQIAVTFLRYYARLAELYQAQADALESSEGNPVVAYDFFEKFTPLAVDFDKIPNSLYEKSIDAVIDIAKSRKSP